ncbi:PREDICTED: caM kinase-like vesicle-associated protein isoform X2 [Propithecus coquereli]|uniref:caM kinase-like vesicle-associated protein isoform X2 n=1 Tax=Propithecus coquereli TaxID=379532 RepID=UPI00063F6F1C|nr:PREDICTED: caM kinase-like vesicle-associated protein isoform X2 [Propithecus coquereli]
MPFGCVTLGDKKNYNQPSEVTDRYDLGQVIKTEEFCEIFRAKDKTTGKLHTCKKFQKRDGRKVRKAAKNEIGILKMVKHPNILQLVDVFVTRKEYFIFLELATGREVFDWILDQGYYSERDTSNVVRQVLEAVAYLHSLKIVHRNLKLENLVYYNRLKNSKIVISDFHLAKLENGLIKEPCGTPEYLGNPPFYEEVEEDDYENHDKNLFRKILAGDYEFDSPYWDDISQAAKDLVTRLMEVEQDQRITAEEAISHEWISGNAASDKNIKDGVCAQIEKNFARAKWKKAVRVTTLMKRLRAPEQSSTAAAQSASATDTATPGAAGGATAAASGAAPASESSASPATEGDAACAAKSDNVASADRSATPATDGSVTPATDGSVTPATDGSITPATDGSVTPATDRSATPATDGRATPATEDSTVPTAQSSAIPATKGVATPELAMAQPDSTAPEGTTGQAPPSSKGEEAAGYAQESQKEKTS